MTEKKALRNRRHETDNFLSGGRGGQGRLLAESANAQCHDD